MNESAAHPQFAAVVILYHPGADVLTNLQSYYAYTNKLYVYDNSELPARQIDWSAYPKVEYHHDGHNRGLAERLNQAAAKAKAAGYEWLLTMDQDSCFPQQMMAHYIRCFAAFLQKEKVAVFGPVHDAGSPPVQAGCPWRQAERLITSGMLLNLSLFETVGGFDEALFIDSVDCDYCIRAKLAGCSLIQFTSVFMRHQLGTVVRRSSIKTLFLVKKQKALHSPVRSYYMLRNLLYLKRKYRHLSLPQVREIQQEVKDRILRYLLYGRNSKQFLRYLWLAYRHYKSNKMGKLGN